MKWHYITHGLFRYSVPHLSLSLQSLDGVFASLTRRCRSDQKVIFIIKSQFNVPSINVVGFVQHNLIYTVYIAKIKESSMSTCLIIYYRNVFV